MAKYECDKCGACCKGHLIVEAYDLDVMREPRLALGQKLPAARIIEYLQNEVGRCIVLSCGSPCCFLKDNQCEIYPTRPNVCVGLEAGDEQCQEARRGEGIPPLAPVASNRGGHTGDKV